MQRICSVLLIGCVVVLIVCSVLKIVLKQSKKTVTDQTILIRALKTNRFSTFFKKYKIMKV